MAFKFNTTQRQATPQSRYATLGRSSLLSVIIFSIINMISLPLSNSYFLFSAYFPFYASAVGTELYLNNGSVAMLLMFSALGLVLLAPYILCYIFSSRHVGWMIGATVMFIGETLFAVADALLMIAAGNASMLADALFHIIISVMLIMASIIGVRRSREGLPLVTLTDAELEAANTPVAPIADVAEQQTDAPTEGVDETQTEVPTPVHSEAVEKEREQQDTKWE